MNKTPEEMNNIKEEIDKNIVYVKKMKDTKVSRLLDRVKKVNKNKRIVFY